MIKILDLVAKEVWLNGQCAEIEKLQNTDIAGMHKKIK